MDLETSTLQLLGASVVFLVGILVAWHIGPFFAVGRRRSLLLYCWHTLFCLVYWQFVLANGGDSIAYYRYSLGTDVQFSAGTEGIRALTSLLSTGLGLSFLGAFLVFNIFGFVGLVALDSTLRYATSESVRYVRLAASFVVFLPSLSFWSSAIGKDAISFLAAGLIVWWAQRRERNYLVIAVAIALLWFVRPHISAVAIVSLIASMALVSKMKKINRVTIATAALVLSVTLIPAAMEYAGVGQTASIEDFEDYVEYRQGVNMSGGGGVDISEMSFPVKMFTYLFRPLPFEAHNLSALASSIENVLLIVLMALWIRKGFRHEKPVIWVNRPFLWMYSLTAWTILALTTANLGISVRQKWMFVPMLLVLVFSVLGNRRAEVYRI